MFLGIGATDCKETKVHTFCKNVSEFALEYRTTREKVLTQHAKKKSYKERKKTRGKLIVDVRVFVPNLTLHATSYSSFQEKLSLVSVNERLQ